MKLSEFEVVAHIFLFLPFSSLQKARFICKQWYDASLDHRLINKEKLVIDLHSDQSDLITKVEQCSRHILHLQIMKTNYISKIFLNEVFWSKLGPRLKSLNLALCCVQEMDLLKALNHCHKLEHLEVLNCTILVSPDQLIPSVALSDMVYLQYLKIIGFDSHSSNLKLFNWTAAKAPNLKTIYFVDCLADPWYNAVEALTSEHILSFFKNKSDRIFDIGFDVSQEYMREDELIKFASLANVRLRILKTNFLPQPIYSTCQLWVQVLVLKAILFLNKSMFESICTNFPNLRELTVDDITGISTALQKLSLLKKLKFLSLSTQCDHMEESDLVAGLCLEVNTTLREFHLQNTYDLSSVFYVEFARTHPALTTLDIASSESLDDWTIQAFFKYLIFLENLSLREANAVDVGWLGSLISAPLNRQEKENPTGFAMSRLKELRVLDLSRSLINVRILEQLIPKLPTIEILHVEQLHITDDFLELIAEKLPCLTEVNVYGCLKITTMGIKILSRCGVAVLR